MSSYKFCNKECKNYNSQRNHERLCKLNPNRSLPYTPSAELCAKFSILYQERAIKKYNASPKTCTVCSGCIPWEGRTNKTCSTECRSKLQSAYNSVRNLDKESAARKRETLMSTLNRKKNDIFKWQDHLTMQYKSADKDNYCKLRLNTCSHCSVKFYSRTQKKYCNSHAGLYNANGRNQFVFTFNVYHYPDLFNLDLIKEHKWRCSKTNPNGVTRDHRVSINEAIRNGYDSYYIKHPLNCELMLFSENNRKKHNSSMTYAELVRMVDKWEMS